MHQASACASPGARWTCWPASTLPSPRSRQLGHRHEGGEEQGSPSFLSANNFIHTKTRWVLHFCLMFEGRCPPALQQRLLAELCEPNSAAMTHWRKHLLAPGIPLSICKVIVIGCASLAQPFAPNCVGILSPVVSTAKETRGI